MKKRIPFDVTKVKFGDPIIVHGHAHRVYLDHRDGLIAYWYQHGAAATRACYVEIEVEIPEEVSYQNIYPYYKTQDEAKKCSSKDCMGQVKITYADGKILKVEVCE